MNISPEVALVYAQTGIHLNWQASLASDLWVKKKPR